jgi:methionyl-tRNA formyltransferase
VRIVFAGTPEVALPSLDALLASRHEVVAVCTRPDAPSGRGKRLTPSPVAERAAALGLETLKPARPRDEEFIDRLTELAPDCCPVVAYGALLPQRVLDIPPQGWVNLHFSLLPAWRGAAPVQRAILAGDQITGATTFRIVLDLDAGPTFATVTEPIRPVAPTTATRIVLPSRVLMCLNRQTATTGCAGLRRRANPAYSDHQGHRGAPGSASSVPGHRRIGRHRAAAGEPRRIRRLRCA